LVSSVRARHAATCDPLTAIRRAENHVLVIWRFSSFAVCRSAARRAIPAQRRPISAHCAPAPPLLFHWAAPRRNVIGARERL